MGAAAMSSMPSAATVPYTVITCASLLCSLPHRAVVSLIKDVLLMHQFVLMLRLLEVLCTDVSAAIANPGTRQI